MTKRVAKFGLLLAASWVVMTTTHEAGHMIGGFLSGAVLVDFDLAPWRLPYSLHWPDPHPLVTLWSGPVLGVAMPIVFAAILRRHWAWFIASFCMTANGAYLALAWISGDRFLDTPRLLSAGVHPATIVVYCFLTIGFGYARFRIECVRCLSAPHHAENFE